MKDIIESQDTTIFCAIAILLNKLDKMINKRITPATMKCLCKGIKSSTKYAVQAFLGSIKNELAMKIVLNSSPNEIDFSFINNFDLEVIKYAPINIIIQAAYNVGKVQNIDIRKRLWKFLLLHNDPRDYLKIKFRNIIIQAS